MYSWVIGLIRVGDLIKPHIKKRPTGQFQRPKPATHTPVPQPRKVIRGSIAVRISCLIWQWLNSPCPLGAEGIYYCPTPDGWGLHHVFLRKKLPHPFASFPAGLFPISAAGNLG